MIYAVIFVVIGSFLRGVLLTTIIGDDISTIIAHQQGVIADNLAIDINDRLTSRLNFLLRLSESLPLALLDDPPSLRAWLAERQKLLPLFSNGLIVVPAHGKGLIAEYPEIPTRSQLDYADRDWFLGARDTGQATIGRPYRGRVSDDPLIVMAVPLGAPGAAPKAVLAGVAALSAPGFLDMIQTIRIGETGGVLLISPRDKLFVSSSDPKMILKDTPPPGVNLLHDRAMAGYRGTGITINAFGVEELSAIGDIPAAHWFAVIRLPTAEAFKAVNHLRDIIIKYGMTFPIFIIVVLFFILPRMFKPLRDSARQIRRMADGEIDLNPLPVVRNDEVGTLVTGFNYLLEQVRVREDLLREREAHMTLRAFHDPLTGLPNRAMFSQSLQQEIAFCETAGSRFILMFLDLDGFKPVNDRYGHAAGDEVLRQVAIRLRGAARPVDIVARLGGDEFVVISIPGIEDPRTVAKEVASRCVEAISLPFAVAGSDIRIGLSVGIALYPNDGQEASQLMAHADAALYCAKEGGRRRFVFFEKRSPSVFDVPEA